MQTHLVSIIHTPVHRPFHALDPFMRPPTLPASSSFYQATHAPFPSPPPIPLTCSQWGGPPHIISNM